MRPWHIKIEFAPRRAGDQRAMKVHTAPTGYRRDGKVGHFHLPGLARERRHRYRIDTHRPDGPPGHAGNINAVALPAGSPPGETKVRTQPAAVAR